MAIKAEKDLRAVWGTVVIIGYKDELEGLCPIWFMSALVLALSFFLLDGSLLHPPARGSSLSCS